MPDAISILPLSNPTLLTDIAADAQADGHGMVTRLITEYANATNRFDRPGEKLYAAAADDRIVAVCGLNLDPFANDPTIARIRRLYVATSHRRRKIATALLHQLIKDATPYFQSLHLRTRNPTAAAFYESLGFIPVENNPHCTHRRDL